MIEELIAGYRRLLLGEILMLRESPITLPTTTTSGRTFPPALLVCAYRIFISLSLTNVYSQLSVSALPISSTTTTRIYSLKESTPAPVRKH